MLFCCGALWAVTTATPLCSQIRIVPRAKLDSLAHPATAADASQMRFGIVVSEWNHNITGALLEGAVNTLKKHEIGRAHV